MTVIVPISGHVHRFSAFSFFSVLLTGHQTEKYQYQLLTQYIVHDPHTDIVIL